MKDLNHEKKPSLRICHIIYGRESSGQRVIYFIDPKGEGRPKKIAEQVVLARLRKRRFDGHTFSGDRLSPNLWLALPLALGNDASQWTQLPRRARAHAGDETRDPA